MSRSVRRKVINRPGPRQQGSSRSTTTGRPRITTSAAAAHYPASIDSSCRAVATFGTKHADPTSPRPGAGTSA